MMMRRDLKPVVIEVAMPSFPVKESRPREATGDIDITQLTSRSPIRNISKSLLLAEESCAQAAILMIDSGAGVFVQRACYWLLIS